MKMIITGGQSGGDLSGNLFAKKHNIETEINTFKDFKPAYEKLPDDIKINYVCDKGNYIANLRCRTTFNVKKADLTIILLGKPIEYTKGSRFTFNECIRLKKDVIYMHVFGQVGKKKIFSTSNNYIDGVSEGVIDLDDAKVLLKRHNPSVINIAGERTLDKDVCIEFLEKMLLTKE